LSWNELVALGGLFMRFNALHHNQQYESRNLLPSFKRLICFFDFSQDVSLQHITS
jgi:hypothetical protein